MKFLELLLTKKVPKLGNKGSIVKVKVGYGRNYLIPKGLAVTVTKENIRRIEFEKKQMQELQAAQKEELEVRAKELEVISAAINVKANEDGVLFGSITYNKIADAFKAIGYDINPDDIEIADKEEFPYPIKKLGKVPLLVRLHPEVTAKTKLWLMKEED